MIFRAYASCRFAVLVAAVAVVVAVVVVAVAVVVVGAVAVATVFVVMSAGFTGDPSAKPKPAPGYLYQEFATVSTSGF